MRSGCLFPVTIEGEEAAGLVKPVNFQWLKLGGMTMPLETKCMETHSLAWPLP